MKWPSIATSKSGTLESNNNNNSSPSHKPSQGEFVSSGTSSSFSPTHDSTDLIGSMHSLDSPDSTSSTSTDSLKPSNSNSNSPPFYKKKAMALVAASSALPSTSSSNASHKKRAAAEMEAMYRALHHAFFLALQHDDVDRALMIYTMTPHQYEERLRARQLRLTRKKQLQQQHQHQQHQQRQQLQLHHSQNHHPNQNMFPQHRAMGEHFKPPEPFSNLTSPTTVQVKEKMAKMEKSMGDFWRKTKETLKSVDEMQMQRTSGGAAVPMGLGPGGPGAGGGRAGLTVKTMGGHEGVHPTTKNPLLTTGGTTNAASPPSLPSSTALASKFASALSKKSFPAPTKSQPQSQPQTVVPTPSTYAPKAEPQTSDDHDQEDEDAAADEEDSFLFSRPKNTSTTHSATGEAQPSITDGYSSIMESDGNGHLYSGGTAGSKSDSGGEEEVEGKSDPPIITMDESTTFSTKTNTDDSNTKTNPNEKGYEEIGILERYLCPTDYFPPSYYTEYIAMSGPGSANTASTSGSAGGSPLGSSGGTSVSVRARAAAAAAFARGGRMTVAGGAGGAEDGEGWRDAARLTRPGSDPEGGATTSSAAAAVVAAVVGGHHSNNNSNSAAAAASRLRRPRMIAGLSTSNTAEGADGNHQEERNASSSAMAFFEQNNPFHTGRSTESLFRVRRVTNASSIFGGNNQNNNNENGGGGRDENSMSLIRTSLPWTSTRGQENEATGAAGAGGSSMVSASSIRSRLSLRRTGRSRSRDASGDEEETGGIVEHDDNAASVDQSEESNIAAAASGSTPSALSAASANAEDKSATNDTATNNNHKISPTSKSNIPKKRVAVTSTPLHEVARMGAYPLLCRMFLNDQRRRYHRGKSKRFRRGIDLSRRDWKNRTPLHLICGGVTSADLLRRARLSAGKESEGGDGKEEGGRTEASSGSKSSGTETFGIPSFYQCALEQKRQKEEAAAAAAAAAAASSRMKRTGVLFRSMLTAAADKAASTVGGVTNSDSNRDLNGGDGKLSSSSTNWKSSVGGSNSSGTAVNGTNVVDGTHEKSVTPDAAAAATEEAPKNAQEGPSATASNGRETTPGPSSSEPASVADEKLEKDRIECLESMFNWVQTCEADFVSDSEEPQNQLSCNSVDARNRTALHYAAELGRSSEVLLLLRKKSMVTIVDEGGLTACELASNGGHSQLASSLEAWAVFERDDADTGIWEAATADLDGAAESRIGEDLLHGVGSGLHHHSNVPPPFSWFQTLDMNSVGAERCRRIEAARVLLDEYSKTMLQEKEEEKMPATDTAPTEVEEDGKEMSNEKDEAGDEKFMLPSVWTNAQVATLLSFHGWNPKVMMDSVRSNPKQLLEDQSNVLSMAPLEAHGDDDNLAVSAEEVTCLICCDDYQESDEQWIILGPCRHGFCLPCLRDYVMTTYVDKSNRVVGRNAGGLRVVCPHHECNMVIPEADIQDLLPSSSDFDALVAAENESFVACANDIAFCPHPGCAGVVQRVVPPVLRENFAEDCIDLVGATCTHVKGASPSDTNLKTYEGVPDSAYHDYNEGREPPVAHRFCFACGSAPHHWPATCETMERWRDKIAEEIGSIIGKDGEEDTDSPGKDDAQKKEENFEDVAHRLWIKANTRPCPKCKTPIEKNEGCNHMTCSNSHCRYEFCWICRKDWSLHNTRTGGYFRCNRWQEDEEVDEFVDKNALMQEGEMYGTSMHSARMARKKARSMARFIHHYSRWTAHRESSTLERRMAMSVASRLAPVVEQARKYEHGEIDMGEKGLSFVHSAFTELLECRSFLQHSYAFAFFRYGKLSSASYRTRASRQTEKVSFEALQSEVELLTEQMSDIVARSHLRASRTQIVFLTSAAAEKRRELSNQMVAIHHEEKRRLASKRKRAANIAAAERKQSGEIGSLSMQPSDEHDDVAISRGSTTLEAEGEVELRDPRDLENDSSMEMVELLGRLVRLGRGEHTDDDGENDDHDDHEEHDDHDDLRVDERDGEEGDAPANEEEQPDDGDEQLDEVMNMAEEDQLRRAVAASIRSHMALAESYSVDSDTYDEEDEPMAEWSCAACTYHNGSGTRCAMCGTSRAASELEHNEDGSL